MRILSGIQPSGTLHLGNYFGMMKPSIELQDHGEAFYFIADLHALTTVHDANDLRGQTYATLPSTSLRAASIRAKRAFFANRTCRRSQSLLDLEHDDTHGLVGVITP